MLANRVWVSATTKQFGLLFYCPMIILRHTSHSHQVHRIINLHNHKLLQSFNPFDASKPFWNICFRKELFPWRLCKKISHICCIILIVLWRFCNIMLHICCYILIVHDSFTLHIRYTLHISCCILFVHCSLSLEFLKKSRVTGPWDHKVSVSAKK